MKKVVYISGTRADFGLMKKTLLELNRYVDLTIIATGMHLSRRQGNTIEEIKKSGLKVERACALPDKDDLGSMVKFFGTEICKISSIIKDINPDLIFVEGDRGEALAGAIIGAHFNIPVVHHGGGDVSDSIDNKIRYGITMFSDYYLVGCEESKKNLENMGIKKVKNVGEPGLDDIYLKKYTSKEGIIKKLGIDSKKPLLLFIYHPNTREYVSLEKQMKEILEALKELNIQTIGLYSNADAGGDIINKALDNCDLSFLKVYSHLERKDFLGCMNLCDAMIGNSSSGIFELPCFNKSFVLIGTRQKGRLTAGNVINVKCKKEEIIQGIKKALSKEFKINLQSIINPYGDGTAFLKITKSILDILRK